MENQQTILPERGEEIAFALNPALSVVIPVLGEARTINGAVARLYRDAGGQRIEVIVVDGDDRAGTLAVIDDPRVVQVRSPAGRAKQMNAGADRAGGDLLLFLHADTFLPPDGLGLIRRALTGSGRIGGAFDLGIDSRRISLRLIEIVGGLRSRITRLPYGDQALFIRKNRFEQLGGFSEVPLMEDVDLMRRIKRRKWPIAILPQKVCTSPRRWEREGVLYGALRNWTLLTLYLMGVSPVRLARHYRC